MRFMSPTRVGALLSDSIPLMSFVHCREGESKTREAQGPDRRDWMAGTDGAAGAPAPALLLPPHCLASRSALLSERGLGLPGHGV